MLSPARMWSKARFTSSSPSVCVIISSTLMRPLMYQSTYCGNWVRPRVPPKAVPRQARPVTSRNGRAWISSPAPATPMMIAWPQPLCAEASACPITSTLPMHSKEKSTPPRVISTTASATPRTAAGSRRPVAPRRRRARANLRRWRRQEWAAPGARHDRPLDHREPDAAEPEDGDRRAGVDPGGVQHRPDAGRDAAAEETHLVERRVGADLRERDLGDDGPFGEGRGPHVMMQHAPAVREPARAVGHETLPLGGEQRAAQVRPARAA